MSSENELSAARFFITVTATINFFIIYNEIFQAGNVFSASLQRAFMLILLFKLLLYRISREPYVSQ